MAGTDNRAVHLFSVHTLYHNTSNTYSHAQMSAASQRSNEPYRQSVSASGMDPKPGADAEGPKKLLMTGRQ